MAALGPDESSRVDLVTGDLDVHVDPVVENLRRDLELVKVRKSLEFAEIRRRLRSAKLRQSAPKSPPEPLVLRSGERWLVLEKCHLRSTYLKGLECRSSWRLGCWKVTQTSCLGSGLTQFEQKEPTQQIADCKDMTEDYKDQKYNNRARTKDSKRNEQQVLVQVSARSTADCRSISRRSCHRKHHQPDDSTRSPTKHSEL